jgi:hypothetical protein
VFAYLSNHVSGILAKQAKTAYNHPKVYENTPQGPPKWSKNTDLEPKGHARSLKEDPRTLKGYRNHQIKNPSAPPELPKVPRGSKASQREPKGSLRAPKGVPKAPRR